MQLIGHIFDDLLQPGAAPCLPARAGPLPSPAATASAYFEVGGRQQTPAYLLSDLRPGHQVPGETGLSSSLRIILSLYPLLAAVILLCWIYLLPTTC